MKTLTSGQGSCSTLIRRLVSAILGATFIAMSTMIPAAAAQDGPPSVYQEIPAVQRPHAEACATMANKLQKTEKAKSRKLGLGRIVNFNCFGGTTTIAAVHSPSVSVSNLEMQADEPDNHYWRQPGEAPLQEVRGGYEGNVEGTVFYGQKTSNNHIIWIRAINIQFVIYLKQNYHDFSVNWSTANQFWNSVSLSGYAQLLEMNGIFAPAVKDYVMFNNGPGLSIGENYSGILEQPSGNHVMSARLADFVVIDPEMGYEGRIEGSLAVPRFLCNSGEQCVYPNGEEAPVW